MKYSEEKWIQINMYTNEIDCLNLDLLLQNQTEVFQIKCTSATR